MAGRRTPRRFSYLRKRTNPVGPANQRITVDLLEPRRLLSFSAPVSYTFGTTNDGFVPNAAPVNVVTADFNGDGKLDLAVAHSSDNSVYISLGNGNGTFQAPIKTAVGEAIQGGLRLGDFNNDGKLDLFLPSLATGYPAIVLLGNGDGTFKPRIDSSSFSVPGTYPRGWAVGDFNGDGKLDVVATLPGNGDTGGYTLLLGNGDGTFKTGIATSGVLGYSRWVTTGDFNGDGKLDLAFADGQQANGSAGNAELSIALGNGDGTFKAPTHYASPGMPSSDTLNPEDVVVGDVNGDGKLDAIVSNYDDNINVFLGNGNGTFQPAVGYSPGQYPRDVVIRDVNGDGKADLVVSNLGINVGGAEFAKEGYQAGSVAVMLGNGNGTFQAPIEYQPFDFPGWTAVGDFNGDGSPDLAVSQVFDGHTVAVMLNNPASSNQPPTLAAGPSATPNPVTGTTATLSALGADDGGESNLTYTWSTTITPPGAVAFSVNGTNAAKNTAVTFTKPGTYYFKVTVTDASGLSAIGMVPVTVSAPPATASFVRSDASTLGTWTGVYGADGYSIFDGTTKLPSYAQVSTSGNSNWVWNNLPIDGRSLQNSPGSSSRIDAAYYSTGSFTLDVNLTDGKTHQVAMYVDDYDSSNRVETVQLSDASTGAVLNTENVASFVNGRYLVWDLSGNVKITITRTGGNNAVASALFFDAPRAASTAAASFVRTDATTLGTWSGTYGSDGYNVFDGSTSLPSYAQVAASGNSNWVWNNLTLNNSSMQTSPGGSRTDAAYYSTTSFTLDVNLTDGKSHQVALYLADYDWSNRAETVQVIDAGTGTVLNTQSVSNFGNGKYLVWNLSGHVKIVLTRTGGNNAVASGILFDPVQSASPVTASFVKSDTTTLGNWSGVYGAGGYSVFNSGASLPAYAQTSVVGNANWVWNNLTLNSSSMQTSPGGSGRIDAAYYSTGSFTLDVNLTDGKSHQVALYMADYDFSGRSQTVQVTDAATGAVLDTRSVTNFANGQYLVWNITGHVKITLTRTAGNNAVASGLLFGV